MSTWNAATIAAPYAAMTSPSGESFFVITASVHRVRICYRNYRLITKIGSELGRFHPSAPTSLGRSIKLCEFCLDLLAEFKYALRISAEHPDVQTSLLL